MCKYKKFDKYWVFFFLLKFSTLGIPHQVDAPHGQQSKNIFHIAQQIPVFFFILKEDLDLLIDKKLRKRDDFATFIAAIEKLPSTKEINISLYQSNNFLNVYTTFFDKLCSRWLKDLLQLSIKGAPENSSTLFQWYLGVNEPDKTELNIGEYEVHECNVSTEIWRNYLDSITMNPKYFDGDTIFYHK